MIRREERHELGKVPPGAGTRAEPGHTVTARRPSLPASGQITELVEQLLPGKSTGIVRLREQVLDLSANICARTVLLRGPIGAGKSTVARAISFLKRIAPLTPVEVERHMKNLRYDGPGRVDIRLMPWYVELPLTGLVESLAESQLFGIGRAKATNVAAGPGIFEAAATGRGIREEAGSKITGGVVFLDEIGELPHPLQAKLLPVLSGGVFYRIGEEGDPKGVQTYNGITITASWRNLEDLLRPDLLSRISAYVLTVPGIADRQDDFSTIVDSIQTTLLADYRTRVENLCRVDTGIDRAYWRQHAELVRPIDEATVRLLAAADWDRLGNLRGLTAVLERIVIGAEDPRYALDTLQAISGASRIPTTDPQALVSRLLSRAPNGSGLAEHVRAIQREDRRHLRSFLGRDDASRAELARVLGVTEDRLATQIQQLARTRVRSAPRRRT